MRMIWGFHKSSAALWNPSGPTKMSSRVQYHSREMYEYIRSCKHCQTKTAMEFCLFKSEPGMLFPHICSVNAPKTCCKYLKGLGVITASDTLIYAMSRRRLLFFKYIYCTKQMCGLYVQRWSLFALRRCCRHIWVKNIPYISGCR